MAAFGASHSLALTLASLKQFQRSGFLRAKILKKESLLKTTSYHCEIRIENGQVLSCILIDIFNIRTPIGAHELITIDEERGPFEWTFYPDHTHSTPRPASNTSTTPVSPKALAISVPPLDDATVPIRIAELHLGWLATMSDENKHILSQIYLLTDGQRTIREIKQYLWSQMQISPSIVEKGLVTLVMLNSIAVRSTR
jgi:hypothetical protein